MVSYFGEKFELGKVLLQFFAFERSARSDSVTVYQRNMQVPNRDKLLWTVDRCSNLSLGEFVEKYDGKRPVLITDGLTGWKANKWSKEFFVKNYGNQRVAMKAVQGSLSKAESLALPVKLFAKHFGGGSPTV